MRSNFTETLRAAAARAYWLSPHFLSHQKGRALILMYHRVIPPAELEGTFVQPGMYVTPETFERHLQFLTAQYEVLSLTDLLDRWQQGSWRDDARSAVITFDDGWLDNYEYAYPLLRRYGVPATIFLATDLAGTNDWLWSDRLGYLLHSLGQPGERERWDGTIERAKSLPAAARDRLLDSVASAAGVRFPPTRRFINWDEAREMSSHGILFGSHTSTHANLTRLSGDALDCELRRPLDVLREQRVNHAAVLSYPNGDHTRAVVDATRAAGYRAAVSTRIGTESRLPSDLFRLKRVGVHDTVTRSVPLLALHIARQTVS